MKTLLASVVVVLGASAAFAGPHEVAQRAVESHIANARAAKQAHYALTGEKARAQDYQAARQQRKLPNITGGRAPR